MLKKFVEYLIHNPYWGVFHDVTESDFGAVDLDRYPDTSDFEKELIGLWNALTVAKRRELYRVVEDWSK